MRTKSKGGRPSKYEAKVAASILEDVAAGVPEGAAAVLAGIDDRTLRRWKKAGRTKPQTDLGRFVRALAQARQRAHARLAKAVYIHAMKDGKLGLQVLARREPREWAEPQQRVQLSGKKGAPVDAAVIGIVDTVDVSE